MDKFYFSRFLFSIQGQTKLLLPAYKGSTLRGGFGHAFRRIVCVFKGRDCAECLLREQCVYSWVFETPVPKEAQMMRKYTAAPHPFVIEPPMDRQESYQTEEVISFGLILIGRAIDYLPYFIYAFEELGRIGIGKGKGKFHLVKVSEAHLPLLHAENNEIIIYRGNDKMLSETDGPIQWQNIISSPILSRIHLSFLTPTRIKYENSLAKNLEFHVFFRNLLRRISLLSYFQCGNRLADTGFKELIEQAKKVKTIKEALFWEDWERYSNRQASRMKMGGLIGNVTYEGNLEPFWPYIKLGEYIHVGKGSSFGLGKYTVSYEK